MRKLKRPAIHCSACDKDRAASSFGKDHSRKSGRYPTCLFCMRARMKARREKNLPTHRARERAASKKCWDANPAARAYHYIRARAKKNGIRFSLTTVFLHDLFATGRCAYCDRKIAPRAKDIKSRASIDKLVPSRGYTPRNTVLACCECNRRKSDASPAELRDLADGVERLLLEKKWGGRP